MQVTKEKARPVILPEYCKGCGRCIDACAKGCIQEGKEIHPVSGLVPVVINLEQCNGCGLCFSACPEPYGLEHAFGEIVPTAAELDRTKFFVEHEAPPTPVNIPDTYIPLPVQQPLVIKGTYASAIGALLAGCRHFFGYPITPSTEGAELMAKLLPKLDGHFLQAVSEVATVNYIYGCGGAGLRSMTFTSSPGFSLMMEGISYMIGSEVPGVFVNVMRGGPGLGNIGPEQADLKLACRGLGHGNTHCIVLCPCSPQEMLDLTMLSFDLAFKYRNPVIILADGYLGQMTGKVNLPDKMVQPGIPAWAVYGDKSHRRNLICSIELSEPDLEKHNQDIIAKYDRMIADEQRADLFCCEDAEILLIATNTTSRMVKGSVQALRQNGVKAGMFRPITAWPFPIKHLLPLLPKVKRIAVIEASQGQLEDELRLAISYAGVQLPPVTHVQHFGGVLPQQSEILEHIAKPVASKA